jgi:hypothetical protein
MKVYIVWRATKSGVDIKGAYSTRRDAKRWVCEQGVTLYGPYQITCRTIGA